MKKRNEMIASLHLINVGDSGEGYKIETKGRATITK
jgi:hypothetical protein